MLFSLLFRTSLRKDFILVPAGNEIDCSILGTSDPYSGSSSLSNVKSLFWTIISVGVDLVGA